MCLNFYLDLCCQIQNSAIGNASKLEFFKGQGQGYASNKGMVKLDHAVLLGNYRKRSGVVGFLLETINRWVPPLRSLYLKCMEE